MMLQKKIYKNIIQIDHKFLIIHTEYIIIGVFGSGKINSLFNLISHHNQISKKIIYMLKIHMKQNINC